VKRLKRIISSALVFTVMASFAVFGTKASATNGLTDLITSDTDIDAILKTPYVDAVPTAFSELLLGIHTTGFGFAKDTILRTGTSTNYDMQVEVKVNGDKISSPEGYYYPSHTALSADAEKKADEPRNIAPSCAVSATYSYGSNLPDFVTDTLKGALPILGRKLAGYDHPDAVLTAVESRSSSPVRIPRDETYQSALRGLYPCGEGAGYAGGILSAAADGMKTAEKVYEALLTE